MKINKRIGINSRVKHNTFGTGTVIRTDDRTTIVLFDDGETKRFINDAFSTMSVFEILDEPLNQIKIERIIVSNLFERLNYNIEINTVNNVAILSAPNGCGKTTIFKFLDFIFNPTIRTFLEIKSLPFDRFVCEMSNGYRIALSRSLLSSSRKLERRSEEGQKYNIAVSLLGSEYDLCFEIYAYENKKDIVTFTQTVIEDQKSGISHMYYDDDDDDRYPTGMGTGKYKRFCTRIDALIRKNNCKVGLDFIVANRLQKTYNPPFYRNQLLAEAMVKFHMIDTATSGIKKVYRIQKEKFFPMPDYDLTMDNQVSVKVYGKILDERYTYILFNHPEFDLETVYLLDQVQKGNGIYLNKEAVAYLRRYNLVEGRVNNLYLSAEVAQTIQEEAQYIKNKAFDDQYYRDMIIDYLEKFGKAQRKDIRKLLWDKLPAVLSDKQKERKILTLLTALKRADKIETDSSNKQISNWVLKK